jgi:tetratricopeptide (TPR) repeat protein
MDSLTPVTAEDFLYLGLAQSYGNPTQGLQTLDRAIEQQPTLMAYVLRAQVRADHAMNTSDLRFAEEAIKDAEAAKTILRGNPSALCISVWVHQIAAGLCAPEEAAKREPILARARKDADDLARFPDLLQAVLVRGWFLEWDGRDEEALRIWERAVQQPEVGQQIAYLYAQGLYRRGEVEKALEFTKTRLPKGGHVLPYARAQFLAEFPNRHAEAIAIFNEILLILPAWQRPPEYAQLLLLLGRKDEAIAKMREGQPQLNHAPRHVRDVWANIGAFLSEPGPQAEQTFLRAAGRSRRDQAGAHFLVGLVRLADGDRRGAREQFEAAVATHCFYYDSYTWSRAYLSRMKQDPNWPAWIPPKN